MTESITAVGIDALGTVCWVREMRPWRLVGDRAVRWVAELPAGAPVPPEDHRLRVMPILGWWPEP